MLETKGRTEIVQGIDQQDFDQIQLVVGAYPFQTGLQKRIPGKVLDRQSNGPVGSIYPFYMVHGRTYTLIDFGTLQIDEVPFSPVVLPALPPSIDFYYDDFTTPVGSPAYVADAPVYRILPYGLWIGGPGIMESILTGFIEPISTVTVLPPPGPYRPPSPPPLPPPSPPGPGPGPGGTGSPFYPMPHDYVDIVLLRSVGTSICFGQTSELHGDDIVYFYDYPGGPRIDSVTVNFVATPGTIATYRNIRLGRDPDADSGAGKCLGDPSALPTHVPGDGWPPFKSYYVYPDGTFGPET